MKDNEHNIKIKVIAGYILIALLALIAMWWVYSKIVSIAATDSSDQHQLYEKSAAASAVISHLYQVDYYGNRLTHSYSVKDLEEYKEALKTLYANIDSLRTKIASERQSKLVNELFALLKEKNINTLELAKIRHNATRNNYYEQSIEEVIRYSSQDSLEHIVVTSTVSNDTIKSITPIKRSFFQRVSDVFAPGKSTQESQKIVASVKIDTLRSRQSPSDSVTVALQKAKETISTNRSKIRRTVTSKLQELIATEQQISTQVALIITELNQEATQSSIAEIKNKRKALESSGRVIAIVAVVAVLIIILFLFFILKDISRSTHYKRELEQARIHAENLMHSRHRMLLNISHDIKAPLCSITGYLDLMDSSCDSNVKKWSELMKISASYIMDLLTNLLEYTRLETGKSIINISAFDMDLMIDDTVKIFTPIAKEKGISLQSNRKTPIGFILSDVIRIRQIVMNLTSNAVKFTHQGDVTITYSLENSDTLVVSVKDSGCGIAKSKLDTIFDEFSRGEKVEEIEGSGLGLAVVRGAVLLLGGKIAVESKDKQGSCFSISIPIKRTNTKSDSIPPKISSITIMVVDDDSLQLKMMTEMISQSGHTVYCASKPEEAIRIVSTQKIDLILTDLQMGTFSGYELLQEIRFKGYVMPIVAVSASSSANKTELQKTGFSDFLPKPFSLAALNSIVANSFPQTEIKSLNELMDGDEDAVKEIMDLFIMTTIKNIELLKKYLSNNQIEETQKLCHKMLPMFLQLQFTEIAQLLKDVDAGDFDSTKISQIITLIEKVINQDRTV